VTASCDNGRVATQASSNRTAGHAPALEPRPLRIPRPLRVLLAANLVSEVGSGLTLPFLLIYLHDVRHISLALAGVLIGASSLVGLPVGPATGALVDKIGPRFICIGALVASGCGSLALILIRSPISAIPVLVLYGIGNGAMWPAFTALFAVMVRDPELRPRVFARNFQVLNLGLGIGSVIAGLIVRTSDPSSFVLIYMIDGLTYASVIVALVALPKRVFERMADPTAGTGAAASGVPRHPKGGYHEVFSDRRFRRYLVSMALLALAGYSAVSAGLVGYATVFIHVHPSVIAWAFAVNTALIVVIQPLGLKLVGKMRRTTALSLCAACFAASWIVLGVAGLFPRQTIGSVLVVAMFGVFALGEVLLSPVGSTLVTALARPSLIGRYNATSSSIFTVTNVLGPAFAGVMLGARLGDPYLAVLVACCGACALGMRHLRKSLSPQIDNAARFRSPTHPSLGDLGAAETCP
jgi:MFS family permease